MSNPVATSTNGRRGLWRWSVALGATLALVVSGSGLVAFAQSGSGSSNGPTFLPADTPIYVTGRLDGPDGQMDALAEMMSAFPGFADPGSFELKLDQLLNGLVAETTGGEFSYTDDVESLMTGELGLGLMNIVEAAMAGADPDILAGVAVSDSAAASEFVASLALSENGARMVEESYGSASVFSDGDNAVAVAGDWVLISPSADAVKSGIDVVAGDQPSLADSEGFASAWARVPAAYIAAAYMDLQSFASIIDVANMMASGQAGMELPVDDLAALLPEDMVAYLAAESDRLTLEAFITPGEQTPALPLGESELALLFPSDTQVYIETRELGATVENALNTLVDTMAMQADGTAGPAGIGVDLADLEVLFGEDSPITGLLGEPLPTYLDFVDDAGVGAALSSDGLWLGIAAEVSDEAVASARVERLMSFLRLAASDPEVGVSIENSTIGDTSTTVITLPIGDLAAEAGLPINVGDTVTIAVADGTMLIGTAGFVEAALTGAPVDSLGMSAGYNDALAGDTVNSGLMYVNISSLLATLDPLLSMMSPEWADIAPYAAGVDRLIAVGTADDEVISTRMTVITNQ